MILALSRSFKIFGLEIYWYAICILIGIIIAVYMGVKEGKRLGLTTDFVLTGVIIIVPIAIIGARLWYILFNLDQGWSFRKIIGLEGGLSGLAIQGGIIFAFIAVFVYCKIRHVPLYKVVDITAPGFFVGQICGRWGNFFNQELFGPVIQTDWYRAIISTIFGDQMNITLNGVTAYRHPVFLYESLLNLVGLIVLLLLRRKSKKLLSGDMVGLYLFWYGCVRILTESLRANSGASEILMLGPIPVSILISVLFIILGIAFLIGKRFIGPKKPYLDILDEVKNKRLDTVMFDLDGTLIDSKPLIDRSFIHTFEKFRPDHILTDEELDSFFGPTLYQTFKRYSSDEEEIEQMIKYYREFNVANHDSIVKPMPSAKEVLARLHSKKYNIAVVSSKKNDLVIRGLEVCGLYKYVDVIVGADDVKNHKPAPDAILLALDLLKENSNKINKEIDLELEKYNPFVRFFKGFVLNKKRKKEVVKACYVGDTVNDITAAKAANVKAIGCLYISHPEVMLNAPVDNVISSLPDLMTVCME